MQIPITYLTRIIHALSNEQVYIIGILTFQDSSKKGLAYNQTLLVYYYSTYQTKEQLNLLLYMNNIYSLI